MNDKTTPTPETTHHCLACNGEVTTINHPPIQRVAVDGVVQHRHSSGRRFAIEVLS